MLADIVHASEVMYGKTMKRIIALFHFRTRQNAGKNKHTHYTPQIYLFQQTNKTRC